ncbi:MAG: ATP-dependent nuclease subunit B-like [Actinomycetia bacterium]|nr:ATP-dependent nuclease subunit B-like [Actinomycetes bacterium]
MGGHLVVTGYGAPAVRALRRVIGAVRGGDPLAPVQVACPSALAAVGVRRAVAVGGGLANVRFGTLPQIVGALAGSGRPPLPPGVRAAAVRAVLDGPLAAAARPVEALFADLDDIADDAMLDRLTALGGRPTEIARLYRAYTARTSAYARPPELCGAAADAPEANLILFASERLRPAERLLAEGLAARGRLHAILCGTGEQPDDTEEWLASLLPGAEREPAETPHGQHVVVAPDAEEEARLAVRRAVAELANGIPPDRIAITYRAAVPYARLIEEQLAAAGVPHHAPAQRTLASSVTGRALLGLLALPAAGFPRAQLMAWLRDAPILDEHGHPVPAARWDRVSREAGIAGTTEQWEQRLTRYLAEKGENPAADGLLAFVQKLVVDCAGPARAATWRAAGETLKALLGTYLGDQRQRAQWGRGAEDARWLAAEHEAHDRVLAALDSLTALDTVGLPLSALASAVRTELERPLAGPSTLGRGVAVAPVRDVAGGDFGLVLVLGMTEAGFPPRLRENPVLRDADLVAARTGLPVLAERRAAERRRFLAAVAAGARTVLSYPRADTRAQRAQHPAPWLLETARHLHGEPVTAAGLDSLTAPWLTRYASFQAALLGSVPASPHEYDVALALGGHHGELDAAEPRYARGRVAAAARLGGEFGPWLGGIDPLAGALGDRAATVLSATSLQTWAVCPRSFLLKYLLSVRDLADPGEEDEASALDRGSLVHAVLEEFFAAHLGRDPAAAWTPADLARARSILDTRAAELAATGRAGRPLLWRAYLAKAHRQLSRVLTVDSGLRAEQRARPLAVEDTFGRDGEPPLTLELPTAGLVSFSGSIDRVDRTDDGALVVIDYKTGKGSAYEAIPEAGSASPDRDLVDRGRRLQLVLYAMAARARHGTPDTPVHAWFWFVERGALRRGATVEPADERRLLDVLDVAVNGIRNGVYPAQPGELGWRGWDSCGFCAYDRVCPSTRGEQWRQVRGDPRVAAYAALTEAGA